MREQFEKLPEIARHMHKLIFQDDLNCYRNKIKSSDIHLVTWVNGAWYAFQKQQAIINVLKAQLECCRRENAVLLGKVGEGEKVASLVESLVSKSEQFGFESEQAEAVLMDLWKALRGEHETN